MNKAASLLVQEATLLSADLTDINTQSARKLEARGRVHDGSAPDPRIVGLPAL